MICILIPKPPHTRLYREHTTVIGGVHVKDLARLNRDLAKIVIVDNSPESYALQVTTTEMCSGSEAGSYLRLIDFVYQSTLGLRVIKKKNRPRRSSSTTLLKATPCRLRSSGLGLEV